MVVKRGVVAEHVESIRRDPAAHAFDLFVIYAAADADFVRGYLLPALNLPPPRVLLVDRLTPGAPLVSEIERGVCRSRFTVAVLSPAYLEDRWAVFGELLASYLSIDDVHVIPLRLANGKFPLRLEARVALDFTDRRRWESEGARLRELLHTRGTAAEQIPCPYPGMRPFATDDASWFFGRDKELGDRTDKLRMNSATPRRPNPGFGRGSSPDRAQCAEAVRAPWRRVFWSEVFMLGGPPLVENRAEHQPEQPPC